MKTEIPLNQTGPYIPLGFVWEFIREENEMEWNDHKGMEINGIE